MHDSRWNLLPAARSAQRSAAVTGTLLFASLVLATAGCQRRTPLTAEPRPTEGEGSAGAGVAGTPTNTDRGQRAQASRRPGAGATCNGRDDCTSDQVCVDARCRYRDTSVAGEILASAAEAQAVAGDWPGAIETYDLAFTAFREHDAPVPPDVACGAASLVLRTATDADARERGARMADHCFRSTVPGDAGRLAVRSALARLRFEGLEIAVFDGDEPAERFFTQEPTRPTVDAVVVEVEMPDLEPREPASHTAVREKLQSEDGSRAIAECFIQDWELRHDRTASAELGMQFSTHMRDMGTYDVFEPALEVQQTTQGEDGFEPCLARTIPSLFEGAGRSMRSDPWSQAIGIRARIQ